MSYFQCIVIIIAVTSSLICGCSKLSMYSDYDALSKLRPLFNSISSLILRNDLPKKIDYVTSRR